MSDTSKPKLLDCSILPATIKLPDLAEFTSDFFDLKLNPYWREAEAGSYAWFDSYEIYSGYKLQGFYDTGLGYLASLGFAEADLLRLRPAMDFLLWVFAFDDMFDDGDLYYDVCKGQAAVDDAINAPCNPDVAQPTFKAVAALLDLFNRMRSDMSETTNKRFVDTAELYVKAAFQQTVNRSIDRIPTVQEFIMLRRSTSGVDLSFVVLEYSLGLNLPDEVHSDPTISELRMAANDIITWSNDIYSFPVEQSRGDAHNLVFITMCEQKIDAQSAINYVDQLIRKRTREYVEAKQSLQSFGPEVEQEVVRYIQGMEYWIQGSIHWVFITPRYFGADAEEVRNTGVVKLTAQAQTP